MWRKALAGFLACAATVPARAAWLEARTPHFIIYSEQSQAGLAHYADQLERFDQAVRPLLKSDDPALSDASKLRIYVLRDQSAVASLTGGPTIAGVYTPRASGARAFVHRDEGSSDEDLRGQTVFQHEYLHHLVLQKTGTAMPLWASEGMAEFFGTARVLNDGSVGVGYVPQYRGFDLYSDKLPLTQMLSPDYAHMNSDDLAQIYARGWLLTHFLIFSKDRQGQLDRYMTLVGQGKSSSDAATEAFGDLRKLDRDLNSYLSRNRFASSTIPAARIHPGGATIRQLSPAEAAILPIQMRSEYGVTTRTAPAVLDSARRVAAQYPSDPTVLAALAEAQQDSGDNAAAIASADRATAADPRSQKALVMKARALMAMAMKAPKQTDYSALRQTISRANRIDPNNAEPLLMFYQTYVLQGVAPTRNSINGLYYAQALVPQDKTLRATATQQLVLDNNLAGAATMFAPIAYDPHATKSAAKYQAVLTALKTGDKAAALAGLEGIGKDDRQTSSAH